MNRCLPLVACFPLVLALAACGDSEGDTSGSGASGATSSGQTTGSGTTTGTGNTSSTSSGFPECDDPTPQPGTSNEVDVSSVQVTARDDANAAIQNTTFQLCGTDLCLTADTNTIGGAVFMNSQSTLDRPLFKPADSLTFAKFGYPYTAESPSPLVGIFPRMQDSMAALVPGQTVSVDGASLALPAGGGLSIDELTFDSPDKQTFRAAQVPANLVEQVTGDATFVMAYALGPIDTLLCPEAKLTVDNYANLAPGTQVEFWVQEVSIEEFFGGYGEWVKIDDGEVSADGATVSTTVGMPVILNVAIRPL